MKRPPAAFTFAVVCEARADQETATQLAERVLLEAIDWLDPDSLPKFFTWAGLHDDTDHLSWQAIKAEAERRHLKSHGSFRSMPGKLDLGRARLALLLFDSLDPGPDAVMLIRDTDGHEKERREGIERARTAEAVRADLGFNPSKNSERLSAEGKKGKRNAKRVLDRLAPHRPRQTTCWRETDLEVLRARGQKNGLAVFLAEVGEKLGRLIAGR